MLDDTYFMKQALIEAGKAAERGEVPVGAVVVCKERIIARAHNLTETLNDVTAHAEKDELSDVEKKLADEKTKKEAVLGEYAGGNKVIRQLIDLALLQNNMLKGEALTNFVKRSIELI